MVDDLDSDPQTQERVRQRIIDVMGLDTDEPMAMYRAMIMSVGRTEMAIKALAQRMGRLETLSDEDRRLLREAIQALRAATETPPLPPSSSEPGTATVSGRPPATPQQQPSPRERIFMLALESPVSTIAILSLLVTLVVLAGGAGIDVLGSLLSSTGSP